MKRYLKNVGLILLGFLTGTLFFMLGYVVFATACIICIPYANKVMAAANRRNFMGLKINVIQGDMFAELDSGKYNFAGHGCNCFHTMGAGIAPKMNDYSDGALLREDMATEYGDINKLGDVSVVSKNGIFLYNMYTQHRFGGDGVYIHWDSLKSALFEIFSDFSGITTEAKGIIPLIGCGEAGGEIADFANTIADVAAEVNGELTIVVLSEKERHNLKFFLAQEGIVIE